MTDTVLLGEGIEGAKVAGSSRNPLSCRGLVKLHGMRCTLFVADFNVKAKIVEELGEGMKRLDESAFLEVNREILCDKAGIYTFDGKPSKDVSAGSATHKANYWRFAKQTLARIDRPHQELMNARNKRLSTMLTSGT